MTWKDFRGVPVWIDESTEKSELPKKVQHGVDCPKVAHVGTGHLHGEDDDTPYDVDGVTYCGRCHRYLPEEKR